MMKLIKGGMILASILFFSCGCAQNNGDKRPLVLIKTDFGEMKVALYNETPKHRDNFLKLAKGGFFDSLLFHRVIRDFMIQGGDPDTRHALPGQKLGNGGPGYDLDNEIQPNIIHKKGALAAAREGDQINPKKKSSGSQFYIVQGLVFPVSNLLALEDEGNKKLSQRIMNQLAVAKSDSLKYYQQTNNKISFDKLVAKLQAAAMDSVGRAPFKFTDTQKQVYTTIGGTPHLDGNYTVFGEVIKGLDVIDKIIVQPRDASDRPLKNVRMKMRLLN